MRISISDAAALVGTTEKILYHLIERGRLAEGAVVFRGRDGRPRLDDQRLLRWWRRERGGSGERFGAQLARVLEGQAQLLHLLQELGGQLGRVEDLVLTASGRNPAARLGGWEAPHDTLGPAVGRADADSEDLPGRVPTRRQAWDATEGGL